MSVDATYRELCDHVRQTALLTSIDSLLGWDERCLLPPAAGDYRAEQIAFVSGLIHERRTDPRVGEWLAALAESPLAADPTSDSGANLREIRRQYEKKSKLTRQFVEELARATVLGQQAWVEARAKDNFAMFRPQLERIVALKREEADAVGYPECRYDALLDDYEPGELTSNVEKVLGALREELVPLVAAIADSGRRPDVSLLERVYPTAAQEPFGHRSAERIGFDFRRGRLDVTQHPFCSTMGPDDCRITTRYDERFFSTAFFGILHEAGHGIYEQGLPGEHFGLPLGDAVSLGVHESQSRLWENQVGRSRAFWELLFSEAMVSFPEALGGVPLDDFYFAINDVRPSLIRVEADEATYNLHILIRFELEQALVDGQLEVADLPAAWNEKYQAYLGLTPPSDADGVLQDIHWSAGLFGYFPTYSLGNLYAAQLFDAASAELGGLPERIRRGDFAGLRAWLTKHVHSQGQRFPAAELIRRATGQGISHVALIAHLRGKLGPLYGLGD